jgi:intraflagellar transport protein 80
MNLRLFRWARALDLAVKYKSHLDTVLAYRQKYLQEFSKTETNPRFLQLAEQVTYEWDTIKAKEEQELDDEGSRRGGGGRGSRK